MKKYTVLVSILTSFTIAFGTVTGVVKDENGAPLYGANVMVDGTNTGAATAEDGSFTIDYDPDGEFVLIASYIGYKTTRLTTSENSDNFISLPQDVFASQEVIVTGMASERSLGATEVSVSRLKASELTEANNFSDMSQMLYGKVSGVDIRKSTGNVGGGWRFDVRAGGGLNGNEQPVVYLDGIRLDVDEYSTSWTGGQGLSTLADLNPEDIESIEILKGPAGATSYGTNGSNGVVLITTKKGLGYKRADGRNYTMRYKTVTGQNEPSYKYSVEKDGYYTAEDINTVLTPGDIRQDHFSISGGTANANYYISFDNRHEEGITIEKDNNYMDRKTVRVNLDVFPSKDINISVSSGYTQNKRTIPMNDNNIFGWIGNTVFAPKRPVNDSDGNMVMDDDGNPVMDWQPYYFTDSVSVAGVKYDAMSKRFVGSITLNYTPYLGIDILKDLKIHGRIGIDDSHNREDNTYRPDLFYSVIPAGSRYAYVRQNQELSYEIGVSFPFNLGPVNVKSSYTVQSFDNRYNGFGIEKQNFITPAISNLGAGEELTYGDEDFYHARDGGSVITNEINFKDQLFMTLSNRSDFGSMIGAKAANVKYNGMRLGWRADETLSFLPSFITMVKPRWAYGESGVLPGLRDNIELLWESESGGAGSGGVLSEIGNTEIEPEKIAETEIGFDAEMYLPANLGALSVEFTSYNQKASQSLVGIENSPSTGLTASDMPVNVGEMEMKGTELLLKYSNDIGALIGRPNLLKTDISYSISHNENEVIRLDDGQFEGQPIYDGFDLQVIQPGLSKYSWYNYDVLGASFDPVTSLYTGVQIDTVTQTMWDSNQDYLERYAGATGVGSPYKKFLGLSGPSDISYFSLNLEILRHFKVYALWDWKKGMMMQNDTKSFSLYFGSYKPRNDAGDQLGFSGPDPESGMEVLVDFDEDGNITGIKAGKEQAYEDIANSYAKMDNAYSDNYLKDASFTKLRELSFSYNANALLRRFGVDLVNNVHIYYSIQNVWTKTDYDGPDPEINWSGADASERGQDFLTLQNPKTHTIGITVTF